MEVEDISPRINLCRRDVAEPLQKFAGELREAANVRGYALALYHFLLLLDAPGKLEKWADTAEAAGSLAEAREHHPYALQGRDAQDVPELRVERRGLLLERGLLLG